MNWHSARPRMLALLLAAALPLVSPRSAESAERTHTVYAGQRLGSIAKRYNVSIEAICTANGISRSDPIRPGQVLIIPDRNDKDGTRAARSQPQQRAKRAPSRAHSGATEHTVAAGQTLGAIARRYHASVEAICRANGIDSTDPIRPGQVLKIPGDDDPTGEVAERSKSPERSKPAATRTTSTKPKLHRVYPGHTLGKIAARYNVSIAALCNANGIERGNPIKPGDVLIIPTPGDADGSHARALRARGYVERSHRAEPKKSGASSSRKSWQAYQKPPWRRGYITLVGYHETWRGYVIGPENKVLSGAREAISRVMGADGSHPRADWRLVRLLAQVSDTFGGRSIRVVSGYRTESYALNSRHKRSQAIDFSIPGVPNEALRDYLLTFARVGVGYYPNSSFVHFDVRQEKTYWVDLAGPGEAPRYVR